MIRAVFFDLDRTLLDRDVSFRNFVVSQHAKFKSALGRIPESVYVSRVTALDDRGALWKDKVYARIVEEFAVTDLSWQELLADFETRITDYYLPFPHLVEMLNTLRAAGYPLGLISNGREEFQMRTIRALGIEPYFDVILISEKVGLRKPDPEIFWRALRELQCEARHGVYVGDNPEVDIAGARRAGMKTAWKREAEYRAMVETNAIFDDLMELPDLLRSL
jgi:putative hydrolase of the HAD superfamily